MAAMEVQGPIDGSLVQRVVQRVVQRGEVVHCTLNILVRADILTVKIPLRVQF